MATNYYLYCKLSAHKIYMGTSKCTVIKGYNTEFHAIQISFGYPKTNWYL